MKLMLFTLTMTSLFGTTVMAGYDMMQPFASCFVQSQIAGIGTRVNIDSGGLAFHYSATIVEQVVAPQALPRVADRVGFMKTKTDTSRKLVLTGQCESGKSIEITLQRPIAKGTKASPGKLVWGSQTSTLSCTSAKK